MPACFQPGDINLAGCATARQKQKCEEEMGWVHCLRIDMASYNRVNFAVEHVPLISLSVHFQIFWINGELWHQCTTNEMMLLG